MGSFVFVLTRGIEDPTRVTRALQLAKAAKENDHEVNIFLTDDAVMITKQGFLDNVVAPTGDEAAVHYQFLLENKVGIFVWIPCAEARQVGENDVDESIVFAGAPKLFELSENASAVYTF